MQLIELLSICCDIFVLIPLDFILLVFDYDFPAGYTFWCLTWISTVFLH